MKTIFSLVSVVVLLGFFLNGVDSLKCNSCESADGIEGCMKKETHEDCAAGKDQCGTFSYEVPLTGNTVTAKGCISKDDCNIASSLVCKLAKSGTCKITCCNDHDFCNSASRIGTGLAAVMAFLAIIKITWF